MEMKTQTIYSTEQCSSILVIGSLKNELRNC